MKNPVFLALALAFAGAAYAQPYAEWTRYRAININTTNANGGANVTQAVANFPVLVRLNPAGDATGANVLAEALPGGADVRFTNAAGTAALPYQIDTWTSSGAAIWVLVPSVAASGTTSIRVYWGRDTSSASSGSAVFNNTSGYTGVWHLNEAGGAGTILDATANGLNGTRHSSVQSVPGVAGTARFYNAALLGENPPTGTASYHVDSLNDNALYRANGSNTRITISAWVNVQNLGQDVSQGIFGQYRYAGTTGRSSYALMHRSSGSFSVLNTTNGTGDGRRVYTNTDFPLQQWRHVVATIGTSADGNVVMYVDGVQQAVSGNATQATFAVPTATVSRPLIGALERSFNQHFIGYIDELRFANGIIRNAAWVKLEYETQKPGATAVTFGATQSNQSRPLFYPTKVANYILNAPITNNVPVVTGTPSGANPFSVVPANLPSGLQFSTSTGVISGTPTVAGSSQQYVVTVSLTGGGEGKDTLNIAVIAGTPPGAPLNVTAVAGLGQVTVSWAAPATSGTTAVSGYLVRAVQDTTKGCAWTPGPLSCAVTGLTNGVPYTFTVRAANSVGYGAASAASPEAIPAGPPGAPTAVTAAQAGASNAVTVSWTPPASNGGALILEYYVVRSPAGFGCYTDFTSNQCTVTGLNYGTAYTFRVYAVNSAGGGDTSATSVPVTPTGILSGGGAASVPFRVTGTARAYTFTLAGGAETATSLTLSITDVWGRAVWSKTVNPPDGSGEVVWNGRASNGRGVSAGMYLIRVSSVDGAGKTSGFVQRFVK